MVKLEFYGCYKVRPAGKVKERARKYYPTGHGDFLSIPQASEYLYEAKSFTSRSRRIVHSRPKNKAATLFKPEARSLSSGRLQM